MIEQEIMMDIKETGKWLLAVYDKFILFVALLSLLASFLLLNVLVDREKTSLAAARAQGPQGPTCDAVSLDTKKLRESMEDLGQPLQTTEWTNRLMVPEIRVTCVACGRPIPYDSDKCPFRNCLAPQPGSPDEEKKDSDLDGMPDWWEKKYGLNPFNPDDAHQDADKDGFSNLEEFLFGSDPMDPENSPPPVAKLRLLKVGRRPMPLSFQGVSKSSDGELIFTLKHNTRRQDYHLRMGQEVDGYEVVGYEQKEQKVKKQGFAELVPVDVSVLKLRRNGKDTELTIYRTDHRGEPAAQLVFLIDGSEYMVTAGDEIKLRKNVYKVVDIGQNAVIVNDVKTGLEVSVEMPLAHEK